MEITLTSKQLTSKMLKIWDATTNAYFECLNNENHITKLERLQIKALMWHAEQVYKTLKELPF